MFLDYKSDSVETFLDFKLSFDVDVFSFSDLVTVLATFSEFWANNFLIFWSPCLIFSLVIFDSLLEVERGDK